MKITVCRSFIKYSMPYRLYTLLCIKQDGTKLLLRVSHLMQLSDNCFWFYKFWLYLILSLMFFLDIVDGSAAKMINSKPSSDRDNLMFSSRLAFSCVLCNLDNSLLQSTWNLLIGFLLSLDQHLPNLSAIGIC